MLVKKFDHKVLTVNSIEKSCKFYHNVLGMKIVTFNNGRKALKFGEQKINLHEKGHEYNPKAAYPTPGSADICLLTDGDIEDVLDELKNKNIQIEQGPIVKQGALGEMMSIYIRDPDKNLIEVSNYN